MNGINFNDYQNFSKKWSLITVRYREDSKELRFTYANQLATKQLDSRTPKYPDGAMFAKISYSLESDPTFPSSLNPARINRFQFMRKDKNKYKDTAGWGYALFTPDGTLFDEDIPTKTNACLSCHQLVKERDYVFSRIIENLSTPNDLSLHKLITFKAKQKAKIKGEAAGLIKEVEQVESLEEPFIDKHFSGTFDEVIPLLIQRAHLTDKPAIFYIDEKNFSLVRPLNERCPNKAKKYHVVLEFNGSQVRDYEFCSNQ